MDTIELRSEKVRNIIGKVPPRIVRSGLSVLATVFGLLLIGSYFFPYTETIHASAQIIPSDSSHYYAVADIPIILQARISNGLEVMIEIEGYNKNSYGQIKGHVGSRNPMPLGNGKNKQIEIDIALDNNLTTANGTTIAYYHDMQGTATIILKKERLLNVIFAWMKR
ncbi:MAG: hypothetical protein ACP5F6_08435 [Microbacter sp.]